MRNTTLYGTNDLIDRFMSALRELGPRDSLNEITLAKAPRNGGADATIRWRVAGESFSLALEVKLSPVGPPLKGNRATKDEVPVVLSPFISRAAQAQLENQGLSYWDPTGNLLQSHRSRPTLG